MARRRRRGGAGARLRRDLGRHRWSTACTSAAAQLSPREIGHRALAPRVVGPGGDGRPTPGEAYLALGVPEGLEPSTRSGSAAGAQALAAAVRGHDRRRRRHPGSGADRLVHGRRLGRRSRASSSGRDGARPGDRVGGHGNARGGRAPGSLSSRARRQTGCPSRCGGTSRALRRPAARAWPPVGRLASSAPRAMIDLSDGLATDAGHLARRSGVRIELDARPRCRCADGVADVAGALGSRPARVRGHRRRRLRTVRVPTGSVRTTPSHPRAATCVASTSPGSARSSRVRPGVVFTDGSGELAGTSTSAVTGARRSRDVRAVPGRSRRRRTIASATASGRPDIPLLRFVASVSPICVLAILVHEALLGSAPGRGAASGLAPRRCRVCVQTRPDRFESREIRYVRRSRIRRSHGRLPAAGPATAWRTR